MPSEDGVYHVLAVHYDIESVADMVKHFQDLGFVGVRNMHKDPEPINCNDARTEVYNAAKKTGAYWFFIGNYDATTGKACRIYRFDADGVPPNRG